MASESELRDKIEELKTKIGQAVAVMEESKADDSARWAKADEERKALAEDLEQLVTEHEAASRATATEAAKAEQDERLTRIEHVLAETRSPSKAAWVTSAAGGGAPANQPGKFISAVFMANGRDYDMQKAGKALLAEMGVSQYVPEGIAGVLDVRRGEDWAKATLGDTAGAGLNIIPNNLLAELVTISTANNPYRTLLSVSTGVSSFAGVDIPLEGAAPARAVIAAIGATKQNVDQTFLKYTATMYTLAKIHDVSVQLLRRSAGAAEQETTEILGRAMALGEAYYILQGTGTSQPKGVVTALNDVTTAYDTADSAGFATVGASVFGAIAKAIGAVENRSNQVTGGVLNPGDFWTYLALEGGTSRPYLNALTAGNQLPDAANFSFPLFGVPLYRDPNMPAGTAVFGDWKSCRLYVGADYRLDTSDEAGTRWDQNLVGFRAEEDIAFNATPYVLAGKFQRITSVGT